MARFTPAPKGVWRLVGRAQRIGFSEGLRGKGGAWLALGVGAWGLQRLRTVGHGEEEVLIREPLAPGQTITITHDSITRGELDTREKREAKDAEKAAKAAKKERKATKRERRRSRR